MANLAESKLREELQKKKSRSVYVFVCDDPFKLDYYADLVAKLMHAGDDPPRRVVFYGDELKPMGLLESAQSLSLWDPVKSVLVRQAERMNAKTWEQLLPLLQEPLEKCVVVFQASKVDGRMKFIQSLSKSGDHAVLVKFEPANSGEWTMWLQSFLREVGKSMDADARNLLLEWTGTSISDLKHTVERAALYAGGATEIRKEHVNAVGFRVAPEDVFRLTGGILSGDRAISLNMLEALLKQGEEPIALLGLLARQYRWLLGILALRAEGKGDNAIAQECGIFPAAAKVLFPAAKRLGGKGVIRGLTALAEADHMLKSSRIPKDHVMTQLVMRLTGC